MDPRSLTDLLERCRFPPPGTEVTCAVSGGPDSTALLVLAVAAGCVVTAVHVDHGLRTGSDAEAEVVARNAEQLGAGFRAERIHVDPGPNLEARARRARRAVLPSDAMTGHTADDQAETLLLNLLRGAGLEGVSAMEPGPTHPLLDLRRHETAAICARLGLETVDDPTNRDPTHRRNRIRHEVLPLLEDVSGRDPVPLLVRHAALARDATGFLRDQSDVVDPRDARALAAAPPVLARTAVRAWLRTCSSDGHPPDVAAVSRVLSVARGEARSTDVGQGWRVRRSGGRLHLEPPTRTR